MKTLALPIAALLLAGIAAAQPKPSPKPLKLVMARQSTVDPVEIIKNLSQKCPNVTVTTNPRHSDYMLYAGGWTGSYRLMIIKHGGDTIFATETFLLSSAVKNVCKFLNSRPAPEDSRHPPPSQH